VEWLLYAAGNGGAVDIQAKSERKEKQTLNTVMMIRKCQKITEAYSLKGGKITSAVDGQYETKLHEDPH